MAERSGREAGIHDHYRRGLGTALRQNQVAYSYSVAITALFGIVADEAGKPNVGQCFLFVVGAGVAFAVVNATITKWFSERLPSEPSEVVAMGTALSLISMAAADGFATLISWWLGPWWSWPLAPFAASIGYIVLAGAEMGIAGYRHEAGGVGGEHDQ